MTSGSVRTEDPVLACSDRGLIIFHKDRADRTDTMASEMQQMGPLCPC